MCFDLCVWEHVRTSMYSPRMCLRARACPISGPNDSPVLTISYTTTGAPHTHPLTQAICCIHDHLRCVMSLSVSVWVCVSGKVCMCMCLCGVYMCVFLSACCFCICSHSFVVKHLSGCFFAMCSLWPHDTLPPCQLGTGGGVQVCTFSIAMHLRLSSVWFGTTPL